MQVRPLGQEDPLEESVETHSSVFCLENPHGRRNLVGCHPRGHRESDTTEVTQQQQQRTLFAFSISDLLHLYDRL